MGCRGCKITIQIVPATDADETEKKCDLKRGEKESTISHTPDGRREKRNGDFNTSDKSNAVAATSYADKEKRNHDCKTKEENNTLLQTADKSKGSEKLNSKGAGEINRVALQLDAGKGNRKCSLIIDVENDASVHNSNLLDLEDTRFDRERESEIKHKKHKRKKSKKNRIIPENQRCELNKEVTESYEDGLGEYPERSSNRKKSKKRKKPKIISLEGNQTSEYDSTLIQTDKVPKDPVNFENPEINIERKVPSTNNDPYEIRLNNSKLPPIISQTKSHEETEQNIFTAELRNKSANKNESVKSELKTVTVKNVINIDRELWDFSRIDQHALKAPKIVAESVESLASYLSHPAESQLEMTRAFYVWITKNIEYDTLSLKYDLHEKDDAESVLLRRKCVCGGYANLFNGLCRVSGIESKVLSGYSKGHEYSAEKIISYELKPNHAWNAVLLQGKWHFVECTWGAGHFDDYGLFQRKFTDFYFLTHPEDFIVEHFPYMDNDIKTSATWQLLQFPISIEQFNRNIRLTQHAMKWAVKPYSHMQAVLNIQNSVVIVLEDRKMCLESMSLRFKKKPGSILINEYTFMRKISPHQIYITVKPPCSGSYTLQLFGQTKKEEIRHEQLMEYIMNFTNAFNDRPFPKHEGLWGILPEAYNNGFTVKENPIPIHLEVPRGNGEFQIQTNRKVSALAQITAAQNCMNENNNYVLLENGENFLSVKMQCPFNDYYKVSVLCKKVENDDGKFHLMATFLVDCQNPIRPCIPFPKIFSHTKEYDCTLLQPLTGQLTANTTIICRFQSSFVRYAMAGGQKMTRTGGEWFLVVKTPNVGENFRISGSMEDGNQYWALYEYEII